ncbi:MAG: type IV toxin-antitoxin system AbiEi family antitoxin domain-containing protein [Patulibacter sp.]|nr:type IV toxin-antitoxin system AbiEi family antitoxin domain-containing protein [Patulibacter sp.]
MTTTPPSPTRSILEAVDRQVGDLASRQHGIVSRSQLSAVGLTRGAIETRIRHGWLRRIHRGVYSVGHTDISQHGRWMAAVLASGGEGARLVTPDAGGGAPPGDVSTSRPSLAAAHKHQAVLSHRSAAALHGLLTRDRGVPEITTTCARPERRGLRVHRSLTLDGSITVRDGIPCTTVARTLIDIAGTGNERAAQRTWATAASRGLIRRAELERELRTAANRPGTAIVRNAYAQDFGYLSQRTRSGNERDALRLCRDFGLPRPNANRLLQVGTEHVEADLLWPEARLIVEVDGDRTHGHAVARRVDRERDLRLQLAGWRTIRIGEDELAHHPRQTAELIRSALTQPPLAPASGAGSGAPSVARAPAPARRPAGSAGR